MNVDELKKELLGKAYTLPIRIDQHEVIADDPELFLRTSFIDCENWKGDLQKCPAYGRLLKFHEATR